jgi:hypothetical protein
MSYRKLCLNKVQEISQSGNHVLLRVLPLICPISFATILASDGPELFCCLLALLHYLRQCIFDHFCKHFIALTFAQGGW